MCYFLKNIKMTKEIFLAIPKLDNWLVWSWAGWAVTGVVLGTLSVRSIARIGGLHKPEDSGYKPHVTQKVEVSPVVFIDTEQRWTAQEVKVTNDQGQEITFKLYIASQEYVWEFESDEVTLFNGRPDDFRGYLASRGLQDSLTAAKAIIVVGVASEEGKPEDQRPLAIRRAQTLTKWVREAVLGAPLLYELNLGQYRPDKRRDPPNKVKTAPQRSVILVTIIDGDTEHMTDQDIEDALRSGLATKELPVEVEKYSDFELHPVT